jgi:hypothetical protein
MYILKDKYHSVFHNDVLVFMYSYVSFEGVRNSERSDKILCKINLVINKYSTLTILFFQEYCLMFVGRGWGGYFISLSVLVTRDGQIHRTVSD